MLINLDQAINFLIHFHFHFDAPAMSEIQSLEMNRTMPSALKKIYAAFGEPSDKACLISGQDTISGPADLKQSGDYIHFLSENQACWSCAYHINDPNPEDPAVYLFGDGKPIKQNDSLSAFLITYLLQESVLSAPFCICQEDGIKPDDALSIDVSPLWLEARYACKNPTHWFYCTQNPRILIMRFDGDHEPWLWMGAYEDHWNNLLRPCHNGYVIADNKENKTRLAYTNPGDFERKKSWWLRWQH